MHEGKTSAYRRWFKAHCFPFSLADVCYIFCSFHFLVTCLVAAGPGGRFDISALAAAARMDRIWVQPQVFCRAQELLGLHLAFVAGSVILRFLDSAGGAFVGAAPPSVAMGPRSVS